MANWYLLSHFLNLDFLERLEFGSPCRVMQLSLGLVGLAILGRAFDQRPESLASNWLENLTSTTVASVRINFNSWLHIRNSCSDPSDGNQMTKMLSADLSNSQSFHWFISPCPRLEIEGISPG
jgi:hypothetical protein